MSGISLHAGRAGYSSLEKEAGELVESFVYLLQEADAQKDSVSLCTNMSVFCVVVPSIRQVWRQPPQSR